MHLGGSDRSSESLRIGISALFQAEGGSLKNLAQLLFQWKQQEILTRHFFILYASQGTLRALPDDLLASVQVVGLLPVDSSVLRRLWVEHIRLPKLAVRDGLDVLFCPGSMMPLLSRTPCVVTFQNAAPFCESVTWRNIGVRDWLRIKVIGILMRITALRAGKIIFISEHFRNLFMGRFRLPGTKSVVIYRARDEV